MKLLNSILQTVMTFAFIVAPIYAQERQPVQNQVEIKNPLVGEWVHDLPTIRKFYDSSGPAKLIYETWANAERAVLTGPDGIDVTFSNDTMTYLRNGKKKVSYPYKVVSVEDGWVHIEAIHFLGRTMKMLFRLDGDVLAAHYSDTREWHPLRVYVRKPNP